MTREKQIELQNAGRAESKSRFLQDKSRERNVGAKEDCSSNDAAKREARNAGKTVARGAAIAQTGAVAD